MRKKIENKPNYLVVGIMAIGFVGIMAGVFSLLRVNK